MFRLNVALLILSFISTFAFAGREVRSVGIPGQSTNLKTSHEIINSHLTKIDFAEDDILIQWRPMARNHSDVGVCLSEYRIYSGTDANDLQYLASTSQTWFKHRNARDLPSQFYVVKGFYSAQSSDYHVPERVQHNANILLDFEADELQLIPYSDEEDVDPDAWEITEEEALPESQHALRISGNTWKKLPFQRTDLTENSVWTIGVYSEGRGREADLQAFGIGDGSLEIFYSFHGSRLYWEQEWVVSDQDVNARGVWNVYKLAVGYDWQIRYGYLPSIDELYFINDNDTRAQPITVYFDDLIDITATIFPPPQPKIRFRFRNDVDGQGTAVGFYGSIDNRDPDELTYLWEFGDGASSELQNPIHFYHDDGVYTASLTVEDAEGKTGSEVIPVEIGRVRNFNLVSTCFTGDVMLARRYEDVNGLITRFGPEYVFEPIESRLSEADLVAINLESLLTDEGVQHPTKGIAFRGNPANVAGLAYAGVDVALLANNHVCDFGERGLEETLEVLDAAGISHNGAGLTEYDALKPVFKTVNGIRFGFLSFCNRTGRDYNERPFLDAAYDRYGYARFSADNLLRTIPEVDGQCDVLVMYTHGGWEYAIEPSDADPEGGLPAAPRRDEELDLYSVRRDSAMRELEHLAIDLGVDMVVGTHPHVLQGFEVYNGVVIAHSMGNFAFDQNFFETWPSTLLCANFDRDGAVEVWIEPLFVNNYRPTPVTGALGRKILDRLAGYSYDLNGIVVPLYNQMRGSIVLDPQAVHQREVEHSISGTVRFIEDEGVYRSEPLKLNTDGFPSRITAITPDAPDPGWRISLGREILLVGNMEDEGAEIWNYNSNAEGSTEEIAHSGMNSSFLIRQQRWQDGVTDLTQRIPVDIRSDRLTLSGWLRTTNGRDGGLVARFYNDRYANNGFNVTGEQVVERRLQGDYDWTFLWQDLTIPENSLFVNVRWQMWGADEGQNQLWADDVELIRWEDFQSFEDDLSIDFPNDLYYLQVQTRRPIETVQITYRTTTMDIR